MAVIAQGRIDAAPLGRARSSVLQSPPFSIFTPHLLNVLLNGSFMFLTLNLIHFTNFVPATVLGSGCTKQITEEERNANMVITPRSSNRHGQRTMGT